MKTLILLRHARSDWQGTAARDFDRPLSARGHRAARAVGRALKAQGIGFDAVLASPAARVVETLAGVEEGYGEAIRPLFDARLYLASAAMLLAILRETDDAKARLLLVGHNPGLESLALQLTRDDGDGGGGLRAALRAKYPTGTLAEIALDVARWNEAEAGRGTLTRFVRPRDLDPALGPDE